MKRAIALLVVLATATAAQAAEREPFRIRRVSFVPSYFDGSRLVGEGSRQRYDGGTFVCDVETVHLPDVVGIDARLSGGATTAKSRGLLRTFRFDLAVDVGIVSGRWGGLLVGGGLGGEIGKETFAPKGRLYPLLLARTRFFLRDDVALHLAYHFSPTSTMQHREREHRAEIALSYGLAMVGLRLAHVTWTAGTPTRTFREVEYGVALGIAVF